VLGKWSEQREFETTRGKILIPWLVEALATVALLRICMLLLMNFPILQHPESKHCQPNEDIDDPRKSKTM